MLTLGSAISTGDSDVFRTTHDGKVWIDDAAGGGARFVIELPGADMQSPAPVSVEEADA